MPKLYTSRYSFLLAILVFYLTPIVLLGSYGKLFMPVEKAWNLLIIGLFFSSIGTAILFWMACRSGPQEAFEEDIENKQADVLQENPKISQEEDYTPPPEWEALQEQYSVVQEQLVQTQNELTNKNEELNYLQHEYQVLQGKLENLNFAQEDYKKALQIELEQQKKLIHDSQQTITDQRESIDKKLQQIAQLESKVSDLTYEIKTLIQLAEIENQSMPIYPSHNIEYTPVVNDVEMEEDLNLLPEKQVRNENQATIQLKRCIDIAQKITGASHYNNSRFKELGVDNYTLDLRRLFDSLRMENTAAIVFYSQKENKMLFINNQSRNLLGWSPDKFVQSFADIVEPSKDIWKHGIASLAIKNDVQVDLKMKSKSGSSIEIQALLGIIPTGIFRHYILGVMFQKIN